jgi:hypothetical protein
MIVESELTRAEDVLSSVKGSPSIVLAYNSWVEWSSTFSLDAENTAVQTTSYLAVYLSEFLWIEWI